MKGIGFVAILLGILGVVYLVAQDLSVLSGDREGRVVVEPLEKARDTVGLIRKNQDILKKGLEEIDK